MMGNKDAITDFNICNFVSYPVYDSCCFMSQHKRCFWNSIPFNNVTTTYAACHDFKQNLFFANAGDRDFFNAYVMVVVIEGG